MVGRFANSVRSTSRPLSPRRARTLVVMASILFLGVFAVIATVRQSQSHALPHIPLAAMKTSLGKNSISQVTERTQISQVTQVSHVAHAAEIVTCPACRLNSLPKVKAFVHGDSKLFPKLKVTFEFGHDPTLYLYDSRKKKLEEIDLAPMDAAEIMRKLYSYSIFPAKRTPTVVAALGADPTLEKQQ